MTGYRFYIITLLLFIILLPSCDEKREKSKRTSDYTIASRVADLRSKGLQSLNKAEYDSAITCGKLLFELAEANSGKMAETASIYGNILLGQGYLFGDSVNLAYPYLLKAESLCKKWENDSALASVYNGFGLYASNIEKDFLGALHYFFQGLDAAKRSSNERLHSILLSNIASIYGLNNDPAGLRYSLECYRQGKRNKDRFLIYTGAIVTAYLYALRNTDTENAIEYIKEAESILKTDSIRDGSSLYYVYGLLKNQIGCKDEAKNFFHKSIEWLRSNREGDVRSYIELARLAQDAGFGRQAVAYLDSALCFTDEGHSMLFRGDVLDALISTHKALGNLDAVDRYREMTFKEEMTEYQNEKEQQIQQMKIHYDLERADNEVSRQRLELLEKEKTLNLLISLIVIALVIAIAFLYLYQRKSRLYSAIVKHTTEAACEENRLRTTIHQLEEKLALMENQSEITTSFQNPILSEDDQKTMKVENSESTTPTQPSVKKSPPSPIPEKLIVAFESLMLDPAIYTDNLVSKEKIAQLLNTNRSYISRLVNERYHKTFPQFINMLRIKEAVRRLADSNCDIPLKALASELGYNSLTTFYTKFSEITGMTPAVFREKARAVVESTIKDETETPE